MRAHPARLSRARETGPWRPYRGNHRANDRLRRPSSASLIFQFTWPVTSVPPAPGSSIMGSPEPQTAETAVSSGPLTFGKGLSAGFGCGAGRYYGCPHGELPELGGPFLPQAPLQNQSQARSLVRIIEIQLPHAHTHCQAASPKLLEISLALT